MISVDAADESRTPFAADRELVNLPLGVFDDSFLCRQHAREIEPNWNFWGRDRWKRAPAGGEFSYYTSHDQKQALAANGPYGISFDKATADFHLSATGSCQGKRSNSRPICRRIEAGIEAFIRWLPAPAPVASR